MAERDGRAHEEPGDEEEFHTSETEGPEVPKERECALMFYESDAGPEGQSEISALEPPIASDHNNPKNRSVDTYPAGRATLK